MQIVNDVVPCPARQRTAVGGGNTAHLLIASTCIAVRMVA
jgi:hypothetical protein